VLCSFQNGIGNEEVLAQYAPAVIAGALFMGGRILAPGRVLCDTRGTNLIGSFEGRHTPFCKVEALASLLTSVGLETRSCTDVRGAKWAKFIFNCAANPVCAATGLKFGQA
jgi:2-dehydropantoate 2-reductase